MDKIMARWGNKEWLQSQGLSGEIEFCPICGNPLKKDMRILARFYNDMDAPDAIKTFPPPHICMRCDLDIRRVTIGPEIKISEPPESPEQN